MSAAPISRKAFLHQLAGGGVALGLAACGGGGGANGPVVAASCGNEDITANHGHTLTVPRADLDSTTPRSYSIVGAAVHDHLVTISVAQFAQLRAGQVVVVTSTEALFQGVTPHAHDVTVRCAT